MSVNYRQPVKSPCQSLQWKSNGLKRLNGASVYLRSLKCEDMPKDLMEEQIVRQLTETNEDEEEEDVTITHLNKGAQEVHNEIVDSILNLSSKQGNHVRSDIESGDGDEQEESDEDKSSDSGNSNNSDENESDAEDSDIVDFSTTHREQPTVNFTSVITSVNFTFITLSIEVSKPSLVWCEATNRGKELIASVVRSSRKGTPVKRM